MNPRAIALADRVERGADALAAFARALSEFQLARVLAEGKRVTGVTWDVVHRMNAEHAQTNDAVTKAEALELLAENSAVAAAAIRMLEDAQLDQAAPVSLYENALLTCQFMLEDHAVRHSLHHLGKIRGALCR